MTSRRLIRTKVLQIIYAHLKNENKEPAESEKDLLTSIHKCTDLFYLTLSLLPDLRRYAELKIDAARNKMLPTEADLNPNMRFAENPVILKIENSHAYAKYIKDNHIVWDDDETLSYFYSKLVKSAFYEEYLTAQECPFLRHLDFVLDIMAEIILNDEIFYQTAEEKSVYWNDDFIYVMPSLLKTLKGVREDREIVFPEPLDRNSDEVKFARTLLIKTLCNKEEYDSIIEQYTENWNIDRMSEMDKMIMDMAIAEWMHFPEIPVKVTINEYLEIAKNYSSDRSNAFINGILDKVLTNLKESGKIVKTGRGLVG